MFQLFSAIANRIKALFVANAALDFEAQFIARAAERKAELLEQADRYEQQGRRDVAEQIRQRAGHLDAQRPLATILPAIEHLQAGPDMPLLSADAPAKTAPKQLPAPAPTKPRRRKGG